MTERNPTTAERGAGAMLRVIRGLAAPVLVALALALAGAAAPAQTAMGLDASELQSIVDAAEAKGLRVIVVEPKPATEAAEPDFSLVEGVETVETSFRALLAGAGRDLGRLGERLGGHWPGAGWTGLGAALGLALVSFALGHLIERLVMRLFAAPAGGAPAARHRERLATTARRLAGIALGTILAAAIFVALSDHGSPERNVGYAVILLGVLYTRAGFAVIDIVFLGDARLPALEPVVRKGRLLVIWLGLSVTIVGILSRLELGPDLLGLLRIVLAALFIGLLGTLLWRHRRELGAHASRGRASLAASLAPAAVAVYLLVALGLFVLDILIGIGITGIGVLAPIYCGVAALVLHAAFMVLLTRRPNGGGIDVAAATSQDDAIAAGDPAPAAPSAPAIPGQRAILAREGAIAFWIATVTWAWGVPVLSATGGVNPFWAILLVVLLARLGWVMVDGFFRRRIEAERGAQGPAEPGDEGGGAGSRLGTLLPLIRTFLLITVVVITAMIVLSKLGVDIAPLFAGAGLVGLAVGFGAQSLVRDIFSGLFFLIDDAFRQGEYIETGGLRGTVEKISIRSMQLRHHTGPLHTIPFGEITNLTNFSRDWVIMKLPLRVTFDTDPEKVRKLVKKLGQELLQDPVIGDKFIEPLKSQGVREIDDSGQIIRVKFMTRPGEQFVLRKQVYARIRELFEREGIEFARKEVRVRVSGGEHLSDQELEQIAGAAAEGATETPPAKA